MDWIAKAFQDYRRCPKGNLTQTLGLGNGEKRLRDLERMGILQCFFNEHESVAGKSKHLASQDMADNIRLLDVNYENPQVPPQYRLLFEKLKNIDSELPRQDVIYKDLLNKNVDFLPNRF